jgi:membrane protease YdiL (CAAX protease family)
LLILPDGTIWLIARGYLATIPLRPSFADALRFAIDQMSIILPLALAEEFFFRGYLQEVLFRSCWQEQKRGLVTRKNLATAALFGLAHALSRTAPVNLAHMGSGLALGWITERADGSIWPAVAVHAAGNLALAWFLHLVWLNFGW